MIKDKVGISKAVVCYLSHRKGIVDENGWVGIRKLYSIIRKSYKCVMYDEFVEFIKSDMRLEVCGNKVRSKCGHTNGVSVEGTYCIPPDVLYYVGRMSDLSALNMGMSGNVHLYEMNNGIKNKIGKSIVLKINSKSMYKNGYKFYKTKFGEWYVTDIPSRYVYLVGC